MTDPAPMADTDLVRRLLTDSSGMADLDTETLLWLVNDLECRLYDISERHGDRSEVFPVMPGDPEESLAQLQTRFWRLQVTLLECVVARGLDDEKRKKALAHLNDVRDCLIPWFGVN